jgi:hypothetical protein
VLRNPFLSIAHESRDRRKYITHRSRRRRAIILRPEVLENRTVLSSYTVLNELDSGPGSLRQAVLDANSAGGSNSISFSASVKKITLTAGELTISNNLEIAGPGANRLSISGNHASRIFDIQSGSDVTIEGLTVTAGLAGGSAPFVPSSGGGILNLGSLTVDDVVLDGNRSVGDPNVVVSGSAIFNSLGGALGGGIENFGTLHVIDTTISNNQALGADNADGSSLPFPSFPGNALGGGIGNFGTLTVTDCTFNANVAQAGNGGIGAFAAIGGGGAIVNDASLTVDGTSFRDNQALGGSNSLSANHNGHALGGGIMSGTLLALLGQRSATLMVSASTFSGNLALGGNDNQVTDAFVPRSDAPDNGYGGGILVYQGSASISSSSLTKNQAQGGTGYGVSGEGSLGVGGGIFFYNFVGGVTASVDGSVITDNAAIGGDGEVGVSGGKGLGGGIAVGGLGSPFSGAGSVTISNTLVTKNLARGGKGGAQANSGDGLGGGLFNDTSSTVILVATAISKNKAKGGPGKGGQGNGDDTYEGAV